jgi:type IV pilus assembly protein PilC
MTVFAYKGRQRGGALVTGEIEAGDRPAAVLALRGRGVVATAVRERKGVVAPVAAPAAQKVGGRVSGKDLAVYTRQFSTMVDAGLPIAQCLSILAEQSSAKSLRSTTAKIAHEVEGGVSLAEAFRKYPKTFDSLYVNMLQVGETGGLLDVVLQRLAAYIEKATALKRKVKGAMVYPATIVTVAILVIIFMLTFVIPTFAQMFKGMGADLPLPTQAVLWASNFTRQWIAVIIPLVGLVMYGIRKYYGTEQGSMAIDTFLLKVPVFGMLIRKVAVARFTRTLGTLIASGVPILEGLLITARTAGNRVVEKAVLHARTVVTAGGTLSEPLKSTDVFPPMVVHMIAVGENTGALDQMLAKIADFYDDEVDTAVSALTALLEPLMIVFLGIVVGGIVVAMYLPIFKMVTLIK